MDMLFYSRHHTCILLQLNDFLVSNVGRFVQTHTLKSSTESFLLRIRAKFGSKPQPSYHKPAPGTLSANHKPAPGTLSANQKPAPGALSANQNTATGTLTVNQNTAGVIAENEYERLQIEEWCQWYETKRREWKNAINDRKHK